MKILVLPNAFKGSLSALKAAQILTRSLQKKHTVRAFPIADGGMDLLIFLEHWTHRLPAFHSPQTMPFVKKREPLFCSFPTEKPL